MVSERILVTGAKGQLGTDLVQLLSAGHEVVGCDLGNFDITDREAVLGAIRRISPTVVLHAAAFTDVDKCESEPELAMRVNADATGFVAEACRAVGAYLVYYSTDYVFDGSKRTPYVETDSPNPRTVYGRSKLAGEEEVRSWEDHCILRLAWVYGAHGRNFVRTMLKLGWEQIRAVQRGEIISPIRVVNDQVGNPSWSLDIARQTEIAVSRRLRGVYHCTADGETSWHDFAVRIFSRLGMGVLIRPCTTEQFLRPAPRPAYSSLENAALKAAGCNIMREWRESLDEFLRGDTKGLINAD